MVSGIPKRVRAVSVYVFMILLLGPRVERIQAMAPVERQVLPNGLILLSGEDHSLPLVTMQVLVDAGSRKDPPGEEGLAHLTANGLLLGTTSRTMATMNEELDFIGASLVITTGRDFITLTLRVLKKDLERGFGLLREALTQPSFPGEEIRKEVAKTLAGIESTEENPMEVAEKAFRKALFGGSPYGHPVEGTRESLARLRREAAVGFWSTYYHPNNTVLAVVGDITDQEVKSKLIPGLSQWPKGQIPKELFNMTFEKGPKTLVIDKNIAQANIVLGNGGVSRGNPDYYALTVTNQIFGGGGFGSRLMEEIRVKRGLAYSVASFFDAGTYPGSFQVVLQTKNASAREAISLVLQEMNRIRQEPVSEEELERAKKYLTGSFPLRLDSQAKLVRFMAQTEYYGLGWDYPERYPALIGSVTKEEILRVANAYMHPESYVLVVVGNIKEAGLSGSAGK